MNILEVQNLCKTYGKGEAAVQALRDVTFSVHKGEFVAIVGSSAIIRAGWVTSARPIATRCC